VTDRPGGALADLALKAANQLEKEIRTRYGGMVTVMQRQFDEDMALVREIRRECQEYIVASAKWK
jgi:uncharacterized protein YqgV (UPF0045/DUF77 family)